MKDRYIIASILIFIFVLIGIQQYMIFSNYNNTKDTELLEKVKQLETKLDSLSNKKDSVKTVIIKLDKDLEYNEKHYEEAVNSILNASDSANRIFIDNYIKQYIERITQN